jgi:hypothetical protein
VRIVPAAIALAVLAFSTCGGGPSAPSEVSLDRDFDLRPGDSASVSGARFVVRFVAVPEDSRCPAEVQCVWAGDATVRLHLRPEGGNEQSIELHTQLEPSEAAVGGYRIRLRLLAPLPSASQPVAPRDYVATLRVVSVS